MTPAISFAIMHLQSVPERRAWAMALCREIQKTAPCAIVKDIKGEIWDTSRRAWLSAARQGCSHLCVLQDDVVLCKDFVAGLVEAVKVRPEHPIGCWCQLNIQREARERGHSWFRVVGRVWGVCTLLPVADALDFIRWERLNVDWQDMRRDDSRLGLYLLTRDMDTWLTVPSLVEHAGEGQSTYLPGGGKQFKALGTPRVAAVYTGESALDIDWSKGLENPLVNRNQANDLVKYSHLLRDGRHDR